MSARDADVLVVGGGPAGSATAARLAARGHDVLVLEKAAFPREKPCAEYLSPGVTDALRRLGALDAVLAAGPARLGGMRLVTAGAAWPMTYPDDDGPRRALGIPRPVFDAALLDHARARGARVRERATVLGALVEAEQVVGVQARVNGERMCLRARCVVAADGLHSAVTRSLGLDVPARWPRRLGLVARYAGVAGSLDRGEMHVGGGLYCGLAPVGHGLVNVGLVGALRFRPGREGSAAFFERRLRELPGVARRLAGARRETPVRGAGPLARRVRRVAGRGYLLVGDAAGFLDPFTGEGVYRALRGAELAATAVERALTRDDALPVGYARARRVAFGDKERVCLLVQAFLGSTALFDYVLARLARRQRLADRLAAVLGDYRPAAPALQPGFLGALLWP
ncbi:MAG TPA: NAD(P)/FAD-dependent oxidoreductase [Chloroflexota bacterium]|nr:NAD(P)/FAD-dependent oxidoreductase [Chloroflexota bacterium]